MARIGEFRECFLKIIRVISPFAAFALKKTSETIEASEVANELYSVLGFHGFWEHPLEHFFEGHGVGANAAREEEIAVTGPLTVRESDAVGVVFPVYTDCERFEVEAVSFLGISFRFFDFSDHSIVHIFSPFQDFILCRIS